MNKTGATGARPLWVAADLGSNTFRLIIAEETAPGTLTEKAMLQSVVRLGQGLGSDGQIAQAALDRAQKCLLEFKKAIPDREMKSITAAVTAAGRDLAGSSSITLMVKDILGAQTIIPTGTEEAALSFRGAISLLPEAPNAATLLDIGGGSTEIASGSGHVPEQSQSLKLGVVRLIEEIKPGNPAGISGYELLKNRASAILKNSGYRTPQNMPGRLLLNAGTPLTLAAMKTGIDPQDTRKLTGTEITLTDVKNSAGLFKQTKRDDILKIHGVVPGREDVIIAGTAILEAFMELSGIHSATVTDGGLCEGLLLSVYEKAANCAGVQIRYHTGPLT